MAEECVHHPKRPTAVDIPSGGACGFAASPPSPANHPPETALCPGAWRGNDPAAGLALGELLLKKRLFGPQGVDCPASCRRLVALVLQNR
jgi:hypothetical protein